MASCKSHKLEIAGSIPVSGSSEYGVMATSDSSKFGLRVQIPLFALLNFLLLFDNFCEGV